MNRGPSSFLSPSFLPQTSDVACWTRAAPLRPPAGTTRNRDRRPRLRLLQPAKIQSQGIARHVAAHLVGRSQVARRPSTDDQRSSDAEAEMGLSTETRDAKRPVLTDQELEATSIGEYKYGFHDEVTSVFRTRRGLDEDVVREISAHKNEPEWMTEFRVKSYRHFVERAMPKWGADPRRDRLREHLLLHEAGRGAGQVVGRPARRACTRRGTSWASPRPRRSTWPASARSTSRRSSTTACRRTLPTRA